MKRLALTFLFFVLVPLNLLDAADEASKWLPNFDAPQPLSRTVREI